MFVNILEESHHRNKARTKMIFMSDSHDFKVFS